MLAFLKSGADFSKGCAHPAMQPPIPATHPRPATQRPEPRYRDSGPKRVTRRANVDGDLS
jgi:hypothetical protein